jgi:pimeloyl-ACP methyl ester carboxylesterase
VWAEKCTRSEYLELFESGLEEAVLDTSVVIDQNILGNLVPSDSRLLLAGVSRGGFLSLVMAAERPGVVSGVVNFVGGWLSINDVWSAEDNEKALKLQIDRFSTIGTRVRAPSVWLYAARDPFYAESTTRRFHRAFIEAGGKGEYFFVATHTLNSGHELGSNPSLWEGAVDEFLKSLQ